MPYLLCDLWARAPRAVGFPGAFERGLPRPEWYAGRWSNPWTRELNEIQPRAESLGRRTYRAHCSDPETRRQGERAWSPSASSVEMIVPGASQGKTSDPGSPA